MKKLDIFELNLDGGDTVYGVIIDTVKIEEDGLDVVHTHLCYAQNKLFYYIERVCYCGIDENTHELTYRHTYTRGNTVAENVSLPDYDACLTSWLERQKLNSRMILIESTLGITVEQEVEICEAIGKILSPGEKHLHIRFDRHFADKELVDKYNLKFDAIDE